MKKLTKRELNNPIKRILSKTPSFFNKLFWFCIGIGTPMAGVGATILKFYPGSRLGAELTTIGGCIAGIGGLLSKLPVHPDAINNNSNDNNG